jgi:4-amino-4-deoxy-L-arabinose transferase-like glycosyltransferase
MTHRPEPTLTAGALTAVVAAVLAVLAVFGYQFPEGVRDAIGPAVAIVAPLIAGWVARRRVTPVDDPQDVDGTPLVPITQVEPPTGSPTNTPTT